MFFTKCYFPKKTVYSVYIVKIVIVFAQFWSKTFDQQKNV